MRHSEFMKRFIGMALTAVLAFGCSGMEELEGELAEFGEMESGLGDDYSLEVIPADSNFVAVLGTGRNSIAEDWRGQCLTSNNPINSSGNNESNLYFSKSDSVSEVEDELTVSGSAKATVGLFTANTKASFARKLKSSSRAIVMLFKASAVTNTLILNEAASTWKDAELPTSPSFFSQCGDTFVSQIKQGGSVYLLVRIDFSTESERVAYEASVAAAYSTADVTAEMKKVRQAFAGRAVVTVNALQVGGESEKLLNAVNGNYAVSCSLDNYEACEKFMAAAANYVSGSGKDVDINNALPANLARSPGNIQYALRDWSAIGDVNVPAQNVSLATLEARERLKEQLEVQRDFQNRIAAVRNANYFGRESVIKPIVDNLIARARKNITCLRAAVRACYDDIALPNGEAACTTAAALSTLKNCGYDELTGWQAALDNPLPSQRRNDEVFPNVVRTDYVTEVTPGVGYWGDWSRWRMCPAGQYAYGYTMRVEGRQGGDDDTALNAVELACGTWDRKSTTSIQPHPGYWGTWQPWANCVRGAINGMRIDIEPPIDGDDTAANNIKAACIDGTEIQAPGGMGWGTVGTMTYCPAGTAVCGASARTERPQGRGDDTAMNGISLLCCAY